ncbi:hypothetical protein [Candidatus Nitrosotalea sp. TS]|uniref:hypothetical protein n=1 Tax=Candidatus Nitrosotalea sp. TS TaxID=2341020 RepID=UPI002106180A|nr:hypothetical protein [Candidatus Nitrosotalea sp. TS]
MLSVNMILLSAIAGRIVANPPKRDEPRMQNTSKSGIAEFRTFDLPLTFSLSGVIGLFSHICSLKGVLR